MIDFTLSENDEQILASVREEALLCRKYARHYEENEHEFPPDELPEAANWDPKVKRPKERSPEDSSMPVMAMLGMMGNYWGDYSVRLRQARGGLGNAALSAAGTPEQKERWGNEAPSRAAARTPPASRPAPCSTRRPANGS
jgi:acyl-CoA dehydrogenase